MPNKIEFSLFYELTGAPFDAVRCCSICWRLRNVEPKKSPGSAAVPAASYSGSFGAMNALTDSRNQGLT